MNDAIKDLALEVLDHVARAASLPNADTAVILIRTILSHWRDAHEDKVTPEKVRAEVDRLMASLDANDAQADAALAARFPKGEG